MPRKRCVTTRPSERTTMRLDPNAMASTRHQRTKAKIPVIAGNKKGAPTRRWSQIVAVHSNVNAARDSVGPGFRNGGTTIVVPPGSRVTVIGDGTAGGSDRVAGATRGVSSGAGRALSSV